MVESADSLDFFARYRDWVVARTLSCGASTQGREVSAYLVGVREEVAKRAFEVLGIDTKSLDAYSDRFTAKLPKRDYSSMVAVYKTLGSAEVEPEISKAAQNREELKPFAKAYLFRSAMQRLGLDWYITRENRAFGGKAAAQKATASVPFSSEGISFMAKYKDWISIKKLSIDEKTKPEEVAAHLSSIRLATDRKTAQILGVDTEALDMFADEKMGGMRKSAANLEKITQILCDADAKRALDEASKGDATIRDAAIVCLFSRMLQNLKIDLEVSPDTLMDMFPGLKIPKPKGNFGGKRKKKAATTA